jgi:hypothetical protein
VRHIFQGIRATGHHFEDHGGRRVDEHRGAHGAARAHSVESRANHDFVVLDAGCSAGVRSKSAAGRRGDGQAQTQARSDPSHAHSMFKAVPYIGECRHETKRFDRGTLCK